MLATTLLKKDHSEVKKLFQQFGRTTARARKTRQRLIDALATELDVHARIEEELFYPAMTQIESLRDMVEEAKEEHQQVKDLLAEIQGLEPTDEALQNRVKELRDAVLHHATEEEQRMFPDAEDSLGREELEQLGEQLAERKAELLKGVIGRVKRAVQKGIRKVA